MAICTSLLMTGPGRLSIEYSIFKREVFRRGKDIFQNQMDMTKAT